METPFDGKLSPGVYGGFIQLKLTETQALPK